MTKYKKRRLLRSPFILFLVLPIIISLLIHLGFVIYAHFTPWQVGFVTPPVSESILLDIKKKEAEVPPGMPNVAPPERPKTQKTPPQEKTSPMVRSSLSVPSGQPGENKAIIIAGDEGAAWLKVDPAWGTREGSGTVGMLHAGPQGTGQTFADYMQGLRDRGLDVVIVVDSTSSMSVMMKEMKLKIGNLALALRKVVPSCRIGIVTYRDKGDEEYVTRVHKLTYGVSSLQRFLNLIEAAGGGDTREAVNEGLNAAVNQMNWNKKSKPFILLIGDAPPHKPDIPACLILAAKFRKEMGGTISVLDVRIPLNVTLKEWEEKYRNYRLDPELETYAYMTDRENVDGTLQSIAEAGGGEAERLINEEKLIKHMLLYTFGTQWEAYFTEIMKNL